MHDGIVSQSTTPTLLDSFFSSHNSSSSSSSSSPSPSLTTTTTSTTLFQARVIILSSLHHHRLLFSTTPSFAKPPVLRLASFCNCYRSRAIPGLLSPFSRTSTNKQTSKQASRQADIININHLQKCHSSLLLVIIRVVAAVESRHGCFPLP